MTIRTPPCTITSTVLSRAEEIGEAIGRAEAALGQDPRLRRVNRIRTIHGSLAIEGNRLSEDQISTILDGKPVVGPLRDIQEARNAIEVYDRYRDWAPESESDLLRAHEILMTALLDESSSAGESTRFIEYMLDTILAALRLTELGRRVRS